MIARYLIETEVAGGWVTPPHVVKSMIEEQLDRDEVAYERVEVTAVPNTEEIDAMIEHLHRLTKRQEEA